MSRYLYLAQMQRLRDEAVGSREADAESSGDESENGYSDDERIEYEESSLPAQFLGTTILRQGRQTNPIRTIRINANAAASDSDAANRNDNLAQIPPPDDDSGRPPSPWGSSRAKQRIKDEFGELFSFSLGVGGGIS